LECSNKVYIISYQIVEIDTEVIGVIIN